MHLQAPQSDDAEVRVNAALAFAKLGDLSPVILNTLFEAADWRSDTEAGSLARDGLVQLGKINPAIVDLMLAALHGDGGSLSGVAECLGEIGQATPAVLAGLRDCTQRRQRSDPYAAVSAAHSLLRLGQEDDSLVDVLLTLYEQSDQFVRRVVLRALGLLRQPSPTVIGLLVSALESGNAGADVAARSLAQIEPDHPRVVAALLQAATANDWHLRGAALAGLGETSHPTPEAVDALCLALADPDRLVRSLALEALGKLGVATPQVLESLRAALADEALENQRLHGTIALTLAQLGCADDAVIAAFLAELHSHDASVRERAARNGWLLGVGSPAVLAALQAALNDEAEMVRNSAASSLALSDQQRNI